LTDFWKIFKY